MQRSSNQRRSAVQRLQPEPIATPDFVNHSIRREALWTLGKRAKTLMAQGVGVMDAFRRARASFPRYLVDVLEADPLTPSKRLFKKLNKLKIVQDESNTGHRLTGQDALRWWRTLLRHRRQNGFMIVAVTVRLSEKLEADASGQTKLQPADFLRRRFDRYLAAALGYKPVGIWATGIISEQGDALHMHGLIAVNLEDLDTLKTALQAAGGAVPEAFRERQAHIKIAYSAGALRYLLKNAQEEGVAGRVRGRTIVVSNALRHSSIDTSTRTGFVRLAVAA